MTMRTALYNAHVSAGGKMVDFAGWQMPIHYGSQVNEHHAVRSKAGVFDVSHMTIVDIEGEDAKDWLRRLLANDVSRLPSGKAMYSCMCNEDGGVIDDLIVYAIDSTHFRMVVNAATREKDIAWLEKQRSGNVTLNYPDHLSMLAVQGPQAVEFSMQAMAKLNVADVQEVGHLAPFSCLEKQDWFIARTGYTGEDGLEITLPSELAESLWNELLALEVEPAGLGARDTLRLEAGMCLYGSDLDEQHTPIESGLSWTVDLQDPDRDFIGREVIEDQKAFTAPKRQVALVLTGKGVLRAGQSVQLVGREIGQITSGTFSPTLQKAIGIARVNKAVIGNCDIIIRDKICSAEAVSLPFVNKGANKEST